MSTSNWDKKITLIYNSREIEDRLTLAELKRIHEFGFKLKQFDVSCRNIPKRSVQKLVHHFYNDTPEDLINYSKDTDTSNIDELINHIAQDSTILKTPLVVRNGKVEQVDTSYDYIYEEIKINHPPAFNNDSEAIQSNKLLYSIGNLLSRKISLLFLLFTLLLGLTQYLSNNQKPISEELKQKMEIAAEIDYSDI